MAHNGRWPVSKLYGIKWVDRGETECNSLAEFLALAERWKRPSQDKVFYRFSKSTDGPGEHRLMAEYDDGAEWWVMWTVDRDAPWLAELPEWEKEGCFARKMRRCLERTGQVEFEPNQQQDINRRDCDRCVRCWDLRMSHAVPK